MRQSVLEAIRDGQWDFEPEQLPEDRYDSTSALPGTEEKVSELAKRASQGLPLWHSADRCFYNDSETE